MRLGLIFSNDWELFGDGSGDYWEIQHRRLHQLLDAAAEHHAPLTVMAEIGQQWAYRRLAEQQSWAGEIADAWDATLVDTLRRGGDVQLHLHPQWLGARRAADKWQLRYEHWALSSLDATQITAALGEGKRYLESLLRPVRPAYRTVLFRAGAFCIEPARHAIAALGETGFLADTSVTKGLYDPRCYDYRQVPSHVLPWEVDAASVARAGRGTRIVELPILATRVWDFPILRKLGRWHYTRWLEPADRTYLGERAAYVAHQYPSSQRPIAPARRDPVRRMKRLASALVRRHAIGLDYDALPAPVFVDCVERLLGDPHLRRLAGTEVVVPVMALGHTKVIPHADNFHRVLSQLVGRLGDRLVFWTGQQAAEYWSTRLTQPPADAATQDCCTASPRRVA